MAVPPFETFLRPTLDAVASNPDVPWRSLIPEVARSLTLTEEDCAEVTPKTGTPRVEDRIRWALTYLRQARLIETPRRGHNVATARGLELLRQSNTISRAELMRYPEFQDFVNRTRSPESDKRSDTARNETESPTERVEKAFTEISELLALEVADRLQKVTPSKFERIIVQLMLKLGYGGTHSNSGEVVGGSGDGGIDGLIRQDRLGLDMVYLQAKRWSNTVGAPEIQGFIGALSTKGATKGVLITTSDFSSQAREAAKANPNMKVSLINGTELAKMMIEHDLGVTPEESYVIKKVDSDFFED